MFEGSTMERLSPKENAGHAVENFEGSGFKQFEEKYHRFEGADQAEIVGSFDVDMDKAEAEAALDAINEYLTETLATVMKDGRLADADEIFQPDKLIEIIKPYGAAAAIGAVCCWVTLKQAYEDYRDLVLGSIVPDYFGKRRLDRLLRRHEEKETTVWDILMRMPIPPMYDPTHPVPPFPVPRVPIPSYPIPPWNVDGPYVMTAVGGGRFAETEGGERTEELQILDRIKEKIADASDAALYLMGRIGIGAVAVAENAVEYGGATAEFLLHHEENAEKIIAGDISGDLKNKLDSWYGRDNMVSVFGEAIEKFGTTAAYLGLTVLLGCGGWIAVASGAGLALGKAGEKTKQDRGKTGELTGKELTHGAVSGASMVAFAELGQIAAAKLSACAPKIAAEINKIFGGKMEPKLLKKITTSIVNGLETGVTVGAYDAPEQLSKDTERALGIDPDAKADWPQTLKSAGAAFLTAAVFTFAKEVTKDGGFYSTYEERINRTPAENGKWTGERGESKFVSDSEEVSAYLKDGKTDGVNYKNGCPDFKPFSKGEVEIPSMSGERYTSGGNFEQADTALAKLRGKGETARDVANWRKTNGYTWHEMNDMKTMQKVPSSINKTFGHLGGVSECKKCEAMMNEMIGKSTDKGGVFDE